MYHLSSKITLAKSEFRPHKHTKFLQVQQTNSTFFLRCWQRLPSLRTCKNPTNVTIPQPNLLMSGSTKIICRASITRKRFCFLKKTTIRSLLHYKKNPTTLGQNLIKLYFNWSKLHAISKGILWKCQVCKFNICTKCQTQSFSG